MRPVSSRGRARARGRAISRTHRRVPTTAVAAAALVTACALTACSSGGATATADTSDVTTSSATPKTPTTAASSVAPSRTPSQVAAARQVRVSVYFLHSGKVSPAPRTVAAPSTAAAALRALLAGPNGYERAHQRTTAIPSGTKLRSIAVSGKVATVDLSGRYDDGAGAASAKARLAQVVFTATRFAGVDKVRFELDGKPVTVFGSAHIALKHPVGRADFEAVSPAVLVESPLTGDTVRTPLRVWGTANTFEAVFRLRVTDSAGRVAADVRVKATSGTGTRGTFDVTFPFHATANGPGTLTAYVDSQEGSGRVTLETVPLTLSR